MAYVFHLDAKDENYTCGLIDNDIFIRSWAETTQNKLNEKLKKCGFVNISEVLGCTITKRLAPNSYLLNAWILEQGDDHVEITVRKVCEFANEYEVTCNCSTYKLIKGE